MCASDLLFRIIDFFFRQRASSRQITNPVCLYMLMRHFDIELTSFNPKHHFIGYGEMNRNIRIFEQICFFFSRKKNKCNKIYDEIEEKKLKLVASVNWLRWAKTNENIMKWINERETEEEAEAGARELYRLSFDLLHAHSRKSCTL